MRFVLKALLAATILTGVACAQSLAGLAPPGSLLTLSFHSQTLPDSTLGQDLAKLDWAKAGKTLDELQRLLESSSAEAPSLRDFSKRLEGQGDTWLKQLQSHCPTLAQALDHPRSLFSDAFLSVSTSSYAPMPAVTLIAKVAAGQTQNAAALQQAIVTCAANSGQKTLEQGGVSLYVIGNGGDFPVVIGHVKGIYFASSSPEVARGVVRRAQGSSEPSFADSDIYKRSQMLSQTGLGFTLDLSALADLTERASSTLASDPESQYFAHRAAAALRTLGGVAGSVSVTSDGVLLESLTAVNPQGGDAKLARLLLCQTCSLITPPLIPSGSVAVHTQYFSLSGLFSYAQDWLDGTKQPINLKQALKENLGLDADKGLLDWLGSSFTTVTLAPVGTDMRGLFYGPGEALIIPVRSQAATQAGLKELHRSLAPLFSELMQSLSETKDGRSIRSLLQSSSDSFTYRGIDVQRYRSGVNTDVGLAYLGSYLVIATPSDALKPIIDTFKGAPNILQDPGYRAALAASPDRVVSLGYSDVQAQADGLASLLRFFSQPLAFGLEAALADQQAPKQPKPSYADLLQLTDILPNALEIIGQHLGSSESYSEVKGDTIYRRTLVHVRW